MHSDEPHIEEMTLAAVMAALSDPMRVAIVRQLAAEGERTCGTFDLGISKATRSHHFRVLREAGHHAHARRGHAPARVAAPRGRRRALPGPARRRAGRRRARGRATSVA